MVKSKNPKLAKDPSNPRIMRAVTLSLVNPNLSLPKAMRAKEFLLQDCLEPNTQMWIRRRIQKKTAHKKVSAMSE